MAVKSNLMFLLDVPGSEASFPGSKKNKPAPQEDQR